MSKDTRTGFKTQIASIKAEIRKKEKQLGKLQKLEKKSREQWTKSYRQYKKVTSQLREVKTFNSKRHLALVQKSRELEDLIAPERTKERDDYRAQISKVKDEIIAQNAKLALTFEQETNEVESVDEIVTQVFELNETIVKASSNCQEYLKRQVFSRLIDEDGNLRSQITFTSRDGLRKVVALVNTMTKLDAEKAAEAERLVQLFFDQFIVLETDEKLKELYEKVKPLHELTRKILISKTEFKVGPDLYRFLGLKLDEKVFPELSKAQTLLQQSIRSEKTNSYIRIYIRESETDNWKPVPQS